MIESIHIEKLRGIREGTLEGLTPLTVLVGPNSSGKSTALDALLMATSPSPSDAVGQSVRRRTEQDADASWLLWRQGREGEAVLRAQAADGGSRVCRLSNLESSLGLRLLRFVRGGDSFVSAVKMSCEAESQSARLEVGFTATNEYQSSQEPDPLPDVLKMVQAVRFIDMRAGGAKTPLPNLYTQAVAQGWRDEVFALLQDVVPGLRSIEILVNPQGLPVLHLIFSFGSVPVALAGDGIRSLLRLCLELVSKGPGLILIEEPEVHQHPRALQQTARALLASVRRGMQVVLSTHSLELIDALLLEAKQEELPLLSTFRLKLSDGVLASSRIKGDDMAFARGQIEEDLR